VRIIDTEKSKIIRSFRRLHEKQTKKYKGNIAVLFLSKYTHTGNRNKQRKVVFLKISNRHSEQMFMHMYIKIEIIDRRDCSTDSSDNNIYIY
jgi:hypothetical protein